MRILFLLAGLLYGMGAWAGPAPGGADLLAACNHSLKRGFTGMQGAMCSYYVTPCDCAAVRKPDAPRVCLPDDVPVAELARKVVAGLKARPGLQSRSASAAAAVILSRDYPCR
ncbi:MAG: Rap1a/Tai family immunity protein [Gammaproteobacteria bacterium]